MKSLQTYLIENLDEGKIWDSIKDWFKSLFEPSDKDFDRYGKEQNRIEGENLVRYKKYLEENFTESAIRIEKIEKLKDLNKIIRPNGTEPSVEEKFGFYEFADKLDDKTDYFGLVYDDSKVKDTACLVNSKVNDKGLEIMKLQVIQEFSKYLPIRIVIKLLKESKEFIGESKTLVVKEKTNKDLYNQVINDCKFEKKYEDDENIAVLKLNEESK